METSEAAIADRGIACEGGTTKEIQVCRVFIHIKSVYIIERNK